MKNKTRGVLAFLFSLILTVSLMALPVNLDQPYMKAAKTNLNQAKGNLNKATPDKGGHRNRALALVNDALDEVNKGLAYDRRNGREDFNEEDLWTEAESAATDQPNMEKAKANLNQAKNNLNNATPDKGGHRNKALDLVKDAIDQVEKGISYDRRN
jgi:hypothetical protein